MSQQLKINSFKQEQYCSVVQGQVLSHVHWCCYWPQCSGITSSRMVGRTDRLVAFIHSDLPLSPTASLHSSGIWLWMSDWSFIYTAHLNIHQSGVLTALIGRDMAGAKQNCCHLSTHHHVHTIQPCTSSLCYLRPRQFVWPFRGCQVLSAFP